MEVWLHLFLTSAVDGGEWSTSHPGRFTFGKESAVHLIGGCVGFKAGLDDFKKRKNSCTMNGFNLRIVQLVA